MSLKPRKLNVRELKRPANKPRKCRKISVFQLNFLFFLLYWTYSGYKENQKSLILCKKLLNFYHHDIIRVQSLLCTTVVKQNGVTLHLFG